MRFFHLTQPPPGAIPRSPVWHRHLRRVRSRARASYHKGLPLGSRRAELLLKHHGTAPSFRRCLLFYMGKQGWHKGASEHAGGQRWQVWPGAWASSPQQPKAPWKQQPTRSFQFPAYDERPIRPQNGRHHGALTTVEPEQNDHGLGGIQRLVNAARKAEQRLLRLQQDKEKSGLQWQQYQRDLQAAYNKERKRHMTAQEQFDKDIALALEKQEEARSNIRSYAASMASGSATTAIEEEGPSWEDLTRSWVEEEEGAMEGVLHRALGATMREREPRTPSLRRPVAARMPTAARNVAPTGPESVPATYIQEELAAARSDPYPHVPSPPSSSGPPGLNPMGVDTEMPDGDGSGEGARVETRPPPAHPGQRDFSIPRVPTAEAPPRMDVKTATKQTASNTAAHSQLGQKLEARRSAMMPFGGKAPPDSTCTCKSSRGVVYGRSYTRIQAARWTHRRRHRGCEQYGPVTRLWDFGVKCRMKLLVVWDGPLDDHRLECPKTGELLETPLSDVHSGQDAFTGAYSRKACQLYRCLGDCSFCTEPCTVGTVRGSFSSQGGTWDSSCPPFAPPGHSALIHPALSMDLFWALLWPCHSSRQILPVVSLLAPNTHIGGSGLRAGENNDHTLGLFGFLSAHIAVPPRCQKS